MLEDLKDLTNEIRAASDSFRRLNNLLKSLGEDTPTKAVYIQREREMARLMRWKPAWLSLNQERHFVSIGEDARDSGSLFSGMTTTGAASASLALAMFPETASTLMGGLPALAGIGGAIGVGVAGLIYAIDQIVSDAIETAENENSAFQRTLQSRLRDAYEDQANGIAEGVSLAAAQEWNTAVANGRNTDQTYLGLESRVQEQKENTLAAGGKSYIETRGRGLRQEEAFYKGEGGEQLVLANDLIGRFYASQDNLETQYQLDAQTMVMTGKGSDIFSNEAKEKFEEMNGQYDQLIQKRTSLQYLIRYADERGDMQLYEEKLAEYDRLGSEAGAILIRAECLAKAEYAASEGAQLELQTQTALIDAVAADTALQEKYYNTGMVLGDHMGQGLAKAIARNHPFDPPSDYLLGNSSGIPTEKPIPTEQPKKDATSYDGVSYGGLAPNGAYGFPYIPYDGFRARLHEGERVLTAQEARGYGKSGGNMGGVTVTVNGLTVREEADIDRIASQLYTKIRQAQMIS